MNFTFEGYEDIGEQTDKLVAMGFTPEFLIENTVILARGEIDGRKMRSIIPIPKILLSDSGIDANHIIEQITKDEALELLEEDRDDTTD